MEYRCMQIQDPNPMLTPTMRTLIFLSHDPVSALAWVHAARNLVQVLGFPSNQRKFLVLSEKHAPNHMVGMGAGRLPLKSIAPDLVDSPRVTWHSIDVDDGDATLSLIRGLSEDTAILWNLPISTWAVYEHIWARCFKASALREAPLLVTCFIGSNSWMRNITDTEAKLLSLVDWNSVHGSRFGFAGQRKRFLALFPRFGEAILGLARLHKFKDRDLWISGNEYEVYSCRYPALSDVMQNPTSWRPSIVKAHSRNVSATLQFLRKWGIRCLSLAAAGIAGAYLVH